MFSLTSSLYPKLVVDYIQQKEEILKYFSYPDTEHGYLDCSRDLDTRNIDHELCDILYEQNKNAGASERTFKNIEQLRSQEAQTAVTGHQISLLGGPLFVPFKVLKTVVQARRLTALLGKPVIPVYWLETNDHDFEEIRKLYLFTNRKTIRKLAWDRDHPKGMSCSLATMDHSLQEVINDFFANLRQTEFTESLKDMVFSCYHEGALLGEASMRLAAWLYSRFGVVLIDPSDDRVKRLYRPVLMNELEHTEKSQNILGERKSRLEKDGYTIDVKLEKNRANLYAIDRGKRRAVFVSEKGTVDRDGKPIDFKNTECVPNVFSRNICQDYLLKPVSCIMGPNELSYYSLLKPLYDNHSVVQPVVSMRIFATLIGKRESRLLKKIQIKPEEFLLNQKDDLKKSMLKKYSEVDFDHIIRNAESETEDIIRKVQEELSSIMTDELKSAIGRADHNMKQNIRMIKEKAKKIEKERLDTLMNRIDHLSDYILPHGQLQERMFTIFQYMNLHGEEYLQKLFDSLEKNGPYHTIMEVQ